MNAHAESKRTLLLSGRFMGARGFLPKMVQPAVQRVASHHCCHSTPILHHAAGSGNAIVVSRRQACINTNTLILIAKSFNFLLWPYYFEQFVVGVAAQIVQACVGAM